MMTSELYDTEKSKLSSTNADLPGQMRGWFKLIETIRSTDPPTSHTNGHPLKSPESSPIQPPPSPIPKHRSIRHKKITIRKSTKSKESLSDNDSKHPSIDLSSSIPFATDLQSLPGNHLNEIRDQRFLDYTDMNTLSTHFQSCLYIEKKSIYFPKQHIFKTRHNALNKIFKLAFLKSWPTDSIDLFSTSSSNTSISSTSSTFKTDWSINRRNSSSKPKNVFHILQLNPKTHLCRSTIQTSKTLSIDEQYQINYEHMKDLLIRTYYPHFHRAFQSKIYFGAKFPTKEMPINSKHVEQTVTKCSHSPPSIFQRRSKRRERKIKEEFLPPMVIKQRRVSEEIPQPVELSIKRKISYSEDLSDDDDDILPDQLPKQTFIKNGLRSNYYKSSKVRSLRRHHHHQFSGSLPPFYTGIFESEDENLSHIDYQLPYDIYWFSQKISLPHSIHSLRPKLEDLTFEEKRIISRTSIFLKRNLRRIKFKQETKIHRHQQEHFSPLIIAQNFYHSKPIDNFQMSHRDLLGYFYNHIRRSHFAKIGRCSFELIDTNCFYAQLGQLTYILNEIFELILNYKCLKSDIYPSNALKKCPLKRLFPMYYELISKPIDLTMIRKKFDQGEYLSYQLFQDDLLLLFHNAITYCGEESDVGRAVKELETYFLRQIKIQYKRTIDLFENFSKTIPNERNISIFENFIRIFHEKEVVFGQIREILAEIIFEIDQNQSPRILKTPYIIHCRCGSNFDETSLVQCYACQLWQHVVCVTIEDTSRPYYCFECHSLCEQDVSSCSKRNVHIVQENQIYSAMTRFDGLIVRINECYFIKKQENLKIFSIERLWFDADRHGYASGFYYLRSNELSSDIHRKVYSNEVFRLSSTNDSISIDDIVRPCYVLDQGTFCKGKPIPEYTNRLINNELFICEYRIDKLGKSFTRLTKSKQIPLNTKTYCFDNYIEKLTIKRDSTEEISRRYSKKFTAKQFEEKSSHIDGLIEKIYCRFHQSNQMPIETNFSPEKFYQQETNNHNRGSKRLRTKISSTITNRTKRRRRSSHSDIIRSVLDQLIDSISSEYF